MSLYEDVKNLFTKIFGKEVAKQVDNFEDPKNYPRQFLEEALFFLGKLLGDEIAIKKMEPIFEKYKMKPLRA